MTQTNTNVTACPNCQGTSAVPLSDGVLLCLDCRNEWNPRDVVALRSVPAIPQPGAGDDDAGEATTHPAGLPPSSVDPVAALADTTRGIVDTDAGWAVLHDLVGTQVVLEGGQVAEIVDYPDDDHVEVLVGIGGANLRTEVVPWDIIERSVDQPAPAVDVDDDTARALAGVNYTVVSLVLQAGLATIAGDTSAGELLTPPSGWLPLDADGLPALEQGCAYAVAFLIQGFGIPREQVAVMAEQCMNVSQQTTSTKGGTDDTDTSTDE